MESLQLSQVLADLSNLGAAVSFMPRCKLCVLAATDRSYLESILTILVQDPGAAEAIVSANNAHSSYPRTDATVNALTSSPSTNNQKRPAGLQRHWSSEKFDKFGRRILTPSSHTGSAGNSIPGTPRRGESDVRQSCQTYTLRLSGTRELTRFLISSKKTWKGPARSCSYTTFGPRSSSRTTAVCSRPVRRLTR